MSSIAKGGTFENDSLHIKVEVDRIYGATAADYVVQVLRYVADPSTGLPTGQPTIIPCTPTTVQRVYECYDPSAKTGSYTYRSRVVHAAGSTGPEGSDWGIHKSSPFAGVIAWHASINDANSLPVPGSNGMLPGATDNQTVFYAGITGSVVPSGTISWFSTWEPTDPTWQPKGLNRTIAAHMQPIQLVSPDGMRCGFQPWTVDRQAIEGDQPQGVFVVTAYHLVNGVQTRIPGRLVWNSNGNLASGWMWNEFPDANMPSFSDVATTLTFEAYTGPFAHPTVAGAVIVTNAGEFAANLSNTTTDDRVFDVVGFTLDGLPVASSVFTVDDVDVSRTGTVGVPNAIYQNGASTGSAADVPATTDQASMLPYAQALANTDGNNSWARYILPAGTSVTIKRVDNTIYTDPKFYGRFATRILVREPQYLQVIGTASMQAGTGNEQSLIWNNQVDLQKNRNPYVGRRSGQWTITDGAGALLQYDPTALDYWRMPAYNPAPTGGPAEDAFLGMAKNLGFYHMVALTDAPEKKLRLVWESIDFGGTVNIDVTLNPALNAPDLQGEIFVNGASQGTILNAAAYSTTGVSITPGDTIEVVFSSTSYTGSFRPIAIITQVGTGGTPV